jgi:hypothetical protein
MSVAVVLRRQLRLLSRSNLIDVVEEDDDLGRGDKRARKVDARRFGVRNQVTEVLASSQDVMW